MKHATRKVPKSGCVREAIMKAITMPKEMDPGEAKVKAAIRIMVDIAMRILEKSKQQGTFIDNRHLEKAAE
jgi:hypothetical protein